MAEAHSLSADVIVVGSGPGGATLSRELSKRGKKVLLLESGGDHRGRFYYGTYAGAMLYSKRLGLLFTQEGLNIVRPMLLGGATNMYCGCAAPPPPWLKSKYGMDIDDEVAETAQELGIAPLPEGLRGEASTRLAQAAQALGYPWEPQEKFMRPTRSAHFDCGAKCMLGCRCHAKWNAAEYVDDAVGLGAHVETHADVERLFVEHGECKGVSGWMRGWPFTAHADTVVLCAGGLGSPSILRMSGLTQAGEGMTMDTTVIVYGITKDKGNGLEPPMTWSWENMADGYMLSALADPWLMYPIIATLKSPRYLGYFPKWKHLLGVMIKLKDEISGKVYQDGTISKPLTARDRERMAEAERVSKRILVEAGADPSTIFTSPLRGTHPSGTVRLGEMVDLDLQTEIPGCYVCDASVFPEALGRPTVLTIIGLAKRLAKHLTT